MYTEHDMSKNMDKWLSFFERVQYALGGKRWSGFFKHSEEILK